MKRKPTKADLEARRRMRENAERTRLLAVRAQAELDGRDPDLAVAQDQEPRTARERRRQMRENAERTRRLAETAQAELDRRREAG